MAIPSSESLLSLESAANELPDLLRQKIASGWAKAAQFEHASIGSFARFTLELLTHGAPPQLLIESQQAGLDEIEHTKYSFKIASIFAGQNLGPGLLPFYQGGFTAQTLEQSVTSTIRDGCFNETLAAIEAQVMSERATEPAFKEVLNKIFEDENKHAQLAFSFVAWALNSGSHNIGVLKQSAHAAIDIQMASIKREIEPQKEDDLSAFGLINEHQRWSLRQQALSQVLVPAFDALLQF